MNFTYTLIANVTKKNVHFTYIYYDYFKKFSSQRRCLLHSLDVYMVNDSKYF